MTRKCAICKETNYRNASSFFSAPKDPQTRQLWQEAIGIENYVVKDETYVCSKHFYPTDIITHWFSGVPPNVITVSFFYNNNNNNTKILYFLVEIFTYFNSNLNYFVSILDKI